MITHNSKDTAQFLGNYIFIVSYEQECNRFSSKHHLEFQNCSKYSLPALKSFDDHVLHTADVSYRRFTWKFLHNCFVAVHLTNKSEQIATELRLQYSVVWEPEDRSPCQDMNRFGKFRWISHYNKRWKLVEEKEKSRVKKIQVFCVSNTSWRHVLRLLLGLSWWHGALRWRSHGWSRIPSRSCWQVCRHPS